LKIFDVDDTRATEDQHSIDFEPKTIAELDELNFFLTQEARLRKIFSWSSWGALQAELKSRIVTETSLDFLLGSIDHVKTKEDAVYYIKQAIPCILHLEHWTLLKLFFLMLWEGLSNAQGKLLDQTRDINSMAEREAKFIQVISDVMNQEILGTIENKAQWKLPTESRKGENLVIGTINIENYRGRRIMESFEKIVDQCIVETEKKQMWRYAVNNYSAAMVILRQKK
jgi:hypothetical protein